METRHIKLNYEEALNAKKQMLASEMNILQIVKRLKQYKILRKRELATKTTLKSSLANLNTKIDLIESTFPEEEDKPRVDKRKRRLAKDERKNFEEELDDIRDKLAKLS